jgi:hypothetical protein
MRWHFNALSRRATAGEASGQCIDDGLPADGTDWFSPNEEARLYRCQRASRLTC